jgi:DNA-binding winged helix-turn-helix (wHTH) protein
MLSETLHLSPRLSRVLDVLEGAHGEPRSYRQIETEACPSWATRSRHNVKAAIHELRRKLRHSAPSCRIETVGGRRGYRLVGHGETFQC